MTGNYYLILINYLLVKENRDKLRTVIKNIKIPEPYNMIVSELYKLSGTVTNKELSLLVKDRLPASIIRKINKEIQVTESLIKEVIDSLMSLEKLQRIDTVLKSNEHAREKIVKIQKIVTSLDISTGVKAKPSTSLDCQEIDNIFEFVYPMSKGELCVICGYTGIGKTRLVLSLVRHAVTVYNLKALYIPIEDWSETTLHNMLRRADDFPEFWVSVYSACNIQDIACEIEYVKPDIVFIDSLTEIQALDSFDDRRYLQLDWIAKQLKRLAQQTETLIVATHQLTYFTEFPTSDDLQDAKSHLLKHCDVCLGIGGQIGAETRNITTIKVRHHPAQDVVTISLDYENLKFNQED